MESKTKEKESWHVGKEIPIAMLFAIFVQINYVDECNKW